MPAEYDVFVSHTWADGDLPRQIAEALRAAGLKVWIDEEELKTFESITHGVQENLAKSKALLAYYSKTYPTRRACQWELTAAFLAAQQEDDPRRRVLVVNPETGKDHIQPIELRDALFAKAPASGDQTTLKSLTETVKKRVAPLEEPLGDLRPLAPPTWYGTKGVGSTRFVGRMEEMWQIHCLLHACDVTMITGAITGAGAGAAQVSGLGGVGKSLLAEEYALRFGAAYPGGVFWLLAHGNDDAKPGAERGYGPEEREAERTRQVQAFASVLLGPARIQGLKPDEIEAALGGEIERLGKPCLWVADDAPGGLDGQALRRWFAPHPLARTLGACRR